LTATEVAAKIDKKIKEDLADVFESSGQKRLTVVAAPKPIKKKTPLPIKSEKLERVKKFFTENGNTWSSSMEVLHNGREFKIHQINEKLPGYVLLTVYPDGAADDETRQRHRKPGGTQQPRDTAKASSGQAEL
jgi:hypothetical protein